jgi:hypothetical protein
MLFIADNLWLNLVIPHRAWHTFVVICIMPFTTTCTQDSSLINTQNAITSIESKINDQRFRMLEFQMMQNMTMNNMIMDSLVALCFVKILVEVEQISALV